MPDRVPIDASRLRAAVSDERYWNAAHPERAAWRRWVAEGYQTLYSDTGRAPGGTVHVRAYVGMGMPWRPMCVASRFVMVRHLVVPVRRAMPRRDQAPLIQSRLPAFLGS